MGTSVRSLHHLTSDCCSRGKLGGSRASPAVTTLAAQQVIDNSEGNPLYIASLGHAYAKAGDITQARQVLDLLEREAATRHVSAYHTGVIYGAIGETDEAFVWLDRAFEERSSWIGYMAVDPRLDGLRSDPRFDALIRKAGLRPRPPR